MERAVLAPVVLFVYNRPRHAARTIEALAANPSATASDLTVFSDAPKRPADRKAVDDVRSLVRGIKGFKSVSVVEREANLGLAGSVIDGVTRVVNRCGKVIVLEDDLVVSPFFLEFMNRSLDFYEQEAKVISVHGYVYPVDGPLPETFFLKGADCWGWATWKRGWDLFEPDGGRLLKELQDRGLVREFDWNGAYLFSEMLKRQIKGEDDSWAVRWHASAFLKGRLTLYPGHPLVRNIGADGSGTHVGRTDGYFGSLPATAPSITSIPIEANASAAKEIGKFFRRIRPSLPRRLWRRLTGRKGRAA